MQRKTLSTRERAECCVTGLSDWNQHREFILANIEQEINEASAASAKEATLAIKRQYRELKRYATQIAGVVDNFIVGMDRIMKQPSTYDRGVAIGSAIGALEMNLHGLQHFGLGMSFDAMKQQRQTCPNALEVPHAD